MANFFKKNQLDESAAADKPAPQAIVPNSTLTDIDTEQINIEEVLSKYDRESNTRKFTGVTKHIITWLLIGYALLALYINVVISLPIQVHRSLFLAVAVLLCFLIFPATKKSKRKDVIPIYDLVLGLIGSGAFFFTVLNFRNLVSQAGSYKTIDIVVGIIGILALMEVCRRAVGLPILVVVSVFLLYAYFGSSIPGYFGHRGFSVSRIVSHLFYTTEGVIGTPLGVCSTFIFLFILFGSFLEKTGIAKFFIDLANSIAGSATGGPAKVAVLASALQGMISGSSVANTVGSGSFTIPMMKKTGYKPEFAAAVEAAASTGGQIMPPIMGAAAFLMAEMTMIGYSRIVLAAVLPAVLYFMGVFFMIHFASKRQGLKGMPKSEMPNFKKLMLERGYLLLPLVAIVFFLTAGFTPSRAALMAILIAIAVSVFRKDTRMKTKDFFDALENSAKNILGVAVACGVAGMIVGVVTLTGLGLKLATGLLELSGGIPIIALFMTMIACIILGMGVPTTANYVIMATICAPIIIKLNIPVLAAHMFVFYFGIVADITPPVALAAYAGSAIARSDPFKTALTATTLAIAAFIVPYVFALSPQMLFIDTNVLEVIVLIITSLIGMVGLSSGIQGYGLRRMDWLQRCMCIAAGLMLIIPETITDIAGMCLIIGVFVYQYMQNKKSSAAL